MQRARAHLFLEAQGPWNVQRMVFREERGPFQFPIIEHVNNIAMAAEHLDASLVLDESSSNSEDSVVLRFSVATEHTAASIGPYMHESYALDDEQALLSKHDQHAYPQDDVGR